MSSVESLFLLFELVDFDDGGNVAVDGDEDCNDEELFNFSYAGALLLCIKFKYLN
jgi:hypothetical protein